MLLSTNKMKPFLLMLRLMMWVCILGWFISLHFAAGCAKTCTRDEHCTENFRCGPGQYCLSSCFVGETNACILGFQCSNTGKSCIQQNNSSKDAAAPEQAPEQQGSMDTVSTD